VDAWGAYIVNARKYVNKPNGLTFPNGEAIPRNYFYFDAEGKMIVKQGIADDTYYVNGISVKPYHGLVEWQGNYYYVDAEGTNAKIIKSMRKYVRNTNGLAFPDGSPVTVGYYEFDAEGKMILKQGFIDDQYYVNGIPLPAYYCLIEDSGSFYYLNDYGKPVKDTRKYVNKTNALTFADGTPIPKDYFYFDAEGKMVIEPEEEKLNGPVDGYFYRDGAVLSSYYGLVEWEGDFYYVDAWGKYIVGARKYVNKPNGLIFADGTAVPRDYFYFDADGKMILD
jgi:glucan-binding YG repeat protein